MKSIGFKKLTLGLGVLTALGGSVLTTGCNSEEIVDPAGTRSVPLEIRANIEDAHDAQTKAPGTDIRTTKFKKDDVIKVCAWDASNGWNELVNDNFTIYNTNGGLSNDKDYSVPETCTDGRMVGIYPSVLFGNSETPLTISGYSDSGTNGTFDFSVEDDQRSDDLYTNSDLMLAYNTFAYSDVNISSFIEVNLAFKHILSKVTITLSGDDGNGNNLSNASINMANVLTNATISNVLSTNPVITCKQTGPSLNCVSLLATNSAATEVTAIIMPQEVGNMQLEITLGGKSYTAFFPEESGFEFKSGKKYNYTLTMTADATASAYLDFLQASIEDWAADDMQSSDNNMTFEK